MIVVRMFAGLGNQLFQYAAARCLAELHKVPLKLDTRWFQMRVAHETPRVFGLNAFSCSYEEASQPELSRFSFSKIGETKFARSVMPRLQLFIQKRRDYASLKSYREPHFHFDPKYFHLPHDVYLVGYFQSERYFKPIEKMIRKEFSSKMDLSKENQSLAEQIKNSPSVAIHVRRGDYVAMPRVHRHHGTCDLSYYQRGVEILSQRVKNPHFYLFSDDIEWVEKHLILPYPCTYVKGSQEPAQDLSLMSLCSHQIIANSSFSWWAAFLNANEEKVVIAPKKWTNVSLNTSDLLHREWILL